MLVVSGLWGLLCDFSLRSKPQSKPHKPPPPAYSRYAQLQKLKTKKEE